MTEEYNAETFIEGKVLTAKYRLIWDEDGIIENDPELPYDQTPTYVPPGMQGFESNYLYEIRTRIMELGLTCYYND